jgi:hypothetical protein
LIERGFSIERDAPLRASARIGMCADAAAAHGSGRPPESVDARQSLHISRPHSPRSHAPGGRSRGRSMVTAETGYHRFCPRSRTRRRPLVLLTAMTWAIPSSLMCKDEMLVPTAPP